MNANAEKLLKGVMVTQRLTRDKAAAWLWDNVPDALDIAMNLDGLQHMEKLRAVAAGRD